MLEYSVENSKQRNITEVLQIILQIVELYRKIYKVFLLTTY